MLRNISPILNSLPEADLGLLQHPRWNLLTIIRKCFILDIAAALDPPLPTPTFIGEILDLPIHLNP